MSCGGQWQHNWKQHELRSAYVSLSDLRSRNGRLLTCSSRSVMGNFLCYVWTGTLIPLRESAAFQDAIAWHDHVFVGLGHTAPSHTKRDEIPLKEERRSGWRNRAEYVSFR